MSEAHRGDMAAAALSLNWADMFDGHAADDTADEASAWCSRAATPLSLSLSSRPVSFVFLRSYERVCAVRCERACRARRARSSREFEFGSADARATGSSDESSTSSSSSSRVGGTESDEHVRVRRRVQRADFAFRALVGQGGFGKVYAAVHRETRRVYAIKAFRKDFLLETRSVAATRFERDALLRVEHPFIVKLRFAFQTAGRLYLVMDFARGGQLLTHLHEVRRRANGAAARLTRAPQCGVFEEPRARFYAAELFLAIEKLHVRCTAFAFFFRQPLTRLSIDRKTKSHDIVHRDIKPENVLLDAAGHVRLTDFGFARLLEEGERSKSFWCDSARLRRLSQSNETHKRRPIAARSCICAQR